MTLLPAAPMPVLLSVPHAGRDWPDGMEDRLRVPIPALRLLEDRFVDLLTIEATRMGVGAVIASHPRAWIDLNRREDELDPAMVEGGWPHEPLHASRKMLGGLGLIPRRLAGVGEIWRTPLSASDVNHRIETVHRPFHASVAQALQNLHDRHGCAVLIDLHSMPSSSRADLVLGDLFGRSAAAPLVDAIAAVALANGFSVARNRPYAGGHVVERHGCPRQGVHAIQIEIDRRLYLQADMASPDPDGVARMAVLVALMVTAAARSARALLPLATG